MRRLLLLMLCALICLAGASAGAEVDPTPRADPTPKADPAPRDLTIVHVTDMHYLSPGLTDYGEYFMSLIAAADGKVTHYTPQLMQAFVDEMLAMAPDAIILSGDLTLNGATRSHEELTALLRPLTEAGIQVLAMSGNHDTNGTGYQFSGSEVVPVEGLLDEEFDDYYADFGYAQAIARDETSMSYVAQLSPEVWCLMLDVNSNGTAGTVNKGTLAWIEEQLKQAQAAGITVISVTHQPALVHHSMFTFGYTINNSTQLLELYEGYQVPLNLCGHLHMQHVGRAGPLVEIAASSLAVSPNQYGVLRVKDGRLADYAMQQTDVSAWAARTGQSDPNLLAFAAYSAGFFDQTARNQVEATLADAALAQQERAQMTAFAIELNAGYFAGRHTVSADDPARALWEERFPNSFFTYYMRTILEEAAMDMSRVAFGEE